MEIIVKRELCEFFTKPHNKIVLRVIEFKKNVDAAVSHYTINKWLRKCFVGFEFPIAIDEILKPGVWQKLNVGDIVSRLLNGWLNWPVKLSYVRRYIQWTLKFNCRCQHIPCVL